LSELTRYGYPDDLANLARQVDDEDCLKYLRSLHMGEAGIIKVWVLYAGVLLRTDRAIDRLLGWQGRPAQSFDLVQAIQEKAVVYFDLKGHSSLPPDVFFEALLQDLLRVQHELRGNKTPSLVAITESSPINQNGRLKLFRRCRYAGISLVMGTQ
jgi:hypothetical protein